MPYLRCPSCGATHYSAGQYAQRDACPRCLQPIRPDDRPPLSLKCRFSTVPEAAGNARQAMEAFRGHLDDDLIATSALLATELVTNSVKHGGPDDQAIEFSVNANDRVVRIEVRDAGEGFEPQAADAYAGRESGWGLFLVDQLARRWGVDNGRGFSVWAEVAASPA